MKTQIQIKRTGGEIEIIAPYSTENNDKFRSRGGKYDRERGWYFPETPATEEMILSLWGQESPLCTVAIRPEDCESCGNQLKLGGYVVASRRGRDYRVEMSEGVAIYSGEFERSGGSVKSPRVTWSGDVLLHVVMRQSFAQAHGLQIVSGDAQEPVNPLAQFSDDQLIAEMQRRGLTEASKSVS